MVTTLTKEAILTADDLPRQLVEVPEWGGSVYVRTLTGAERDVWEEELFEANKRGRNGSTGFENIRAKICAKTICNEAGERLFSDTDIEALGKKSAAALDRCFDIARKINRIGEGDIKELEGN